MQTFLDQPEATFYHITPLENLESICREGIKGRHHEIFVSRVGEMPVLAAIIMEQLVHDIQEASGIAVLKIPQALNHFTTADIFEDYRAPVERTGVLQNMIRRALIPVGCFETMLTIEFREHRDFYFGLFNQLAQQANLLYPKQVIYQRARALNVNKFPNKLPEWNPSS